LVYEKCIFVKENTFMRYIYFFLAYLFFCSNLLFSQITVNSNDFVNPNTSLTYRAVGTTGLFGLNAGQAGENRVWNFSTISLGSPYEDEFLPTSETNIVYQFVFGFGANASNIAKADANAISLPPQAGITLENVFNFYQKNNEGYAQKGFGAEISGFPVPIAFSGSDRQFKFPLNYGNRDTSTFSFQIDIPTLGYYGRRATRINHVDGWGTLRTPYGEFNALRIKSTLIPNDSLFIDTLGFGFNIPTPNEITYKWITPGSLYSMVEFTANVIFGSEIISRAIVQEVDPTSTNNKSNQPQLIEVFPNPSKDYIQLQFNQLHAGPVEISLMDLQGRCVLKKHYNHGGGDFSSQISIQELKLNNGVYSLQLQSAIQGLHTKAVVIYNH